MSMADLSADAYLLVTNTFIQTESDMNGFGPAKRTKYILHYVIKGSGYYEVDNNVYHITAGQSFIIYPGETVTYYPDPEDPWIYAWVNFYGIEAGELLSFIGFSKHNRVAPAIDSDIIMPLFKQMENPSRAASQAVNTKNNGYLHILLSIYMEQFPGKTEGISKKLQQITDYISERFTDPDLTVNEISDKFWTSRSQLYRDFNKGFGMSPNRYIMQFRVLKAVQMFRQGERSICRIAQATGFNDQFYFSRVFKKITGKTPAHFRKAVNVLSDN